MKGILALTALCAAGVAYADDSMQNSGGCCCICYEDMFGENPNIVINPSAYPLQNGGWNLYVTGAFTYWTAREDGLSYAIDLRRPPAIGEELVPDWKVEPGFKVGIGSFLCHDEWDVFVEYTWFRTDSSRFTGVSSDALNGEITPLWTIVNASAAGIIATTNSWKLDFDVIDASLRRNYFVSQFLTLCPFIGLKGTWQEQHYAVSYTHSTLDFDQTFQTQDVWGLGIRAGVDTAWHFWKCFSLIGDAAVTALWENFDVKRSDGVNGVLQTVWERSNEFTVKAILEMMIGLRWDQWVCCDCYHFSLEAGWELQMWMEQNQFIAYFGDQISPSNSGELIFQGLTVKARFDF